MTRAGDGADAVDVAAFTDTFAASDWARVEVRIGDWELRLGRAHGVPGFSSPVSVEVGSPDLAQCVAVVAPHVATVRLAPVQGAAPWAALGDRVTAETQVCALEVMRKQRPLLAGVAGVVRRICVADGALVEAGQALCYVEQDG